MSIWEAIVAIVMLTVEAFFRNIFKIIGVAFVIVWCTGAGAGSATVIAFLLCLLF